MTDLEKFLALLADLGVPEQDYGGWTRTDQPEGLPGVAVAVTLESGYSDDGKVVGYGGFISRWSFDAAGKLINIGNWE